MALFFTVTELETHLYGEVIAAINRADETKAETAIKAATAEAIGYLTAYDTEAIFTATGDNRNPILLLYIKDVAVWHFIQLSNPAVDMELRQTRYEKALKWFEKVQAGKTNPSLPLPAPPADGSSAENFLRFGGIAKRSNNF